MVLNKEAFFGSTTKAARPRVFDRYRRVVKLASVGAAPLYPVLSPLAFNTSTNLWVIWANGGANGTGTIRALIWPDAIQTHATEEVLGVVMFRGQVHRDDIPVPGGETQNNLDTALKTGLRERGIDVEGLVGVN